MSEWQMPPDVADRVLRSPYGCWEWTGSLNPAGYASWKNRAAHRTVYEMLVGPIPKGLVLDHLCRNTACVNPAHLEPVTNKTNILRGYSPYALNARKTHCPLGHAYEGRNLYDGGGSVGRRCRECCRQANQRRRDRKGRTPRGKRDPRVTHAEPITTDLGGYNRGNAVNTSRLQEQDVREIRRLWCEGVKGRELAARYGVHWTAVSQIIKRKTWKHI